MAPRCGQCGADVPAMLVLQWMANQESHLVRREAALELKEARLRTRARCKCEHCGRRTRVGR